jgi:hypothetical protein
MSLARWLRNPIIMAALFEFVVLAALVAALVSGK